MGKAEALKKYEAEYLKHKSPAAQAKYATKTPEKKYSAIMSWRHNQRVKARRAADGLTIAEHVKTMLRQMKNTPTLTEEAINEAQKELMNLHEYLEGRRRDLRDMEAAALRAQRDQLDRRLAALEEGAK